MPRHHTGTTYLTPRMTMMMVAICHHISLSTTKCQRIGIVSLRRNKVSKQSLFDNRFRNHSCSMRHSQNQELSASAKSRNPCQEASSYPACETPSAEAAKRGRASNQNRSNLQTGINRDFPAAACKTTREHRCPSIRERTFSSQLW